MLDKKKIRFLFYIMMLLEFVSSIKGENIQLKEQIHAEIKNGIPEWMLKQISRDLSSVPKSGITKTMIMDTLKQDNMCILFKIKNGNINVEYNSKIPGDYYGGIDVMKDTLKELNSYIPLPNVEFIYSVDDSPFNRQKLETFTQELYPTQYIAPVLAPCKHISNLNAVLVPGYQILKSIKNNVVGEIARGNSIYPWESKTNKAFWRGATTGGLYRMHNYTQMPRVKLVKLATHFPELIDAKFNYFWEVDDETSNKLRELKYLGNSLLVSEHIQYKYQILIDGNSASWPRAYWQFRSNSVVFKQNSPYIIWCDTFFKPWIHYIPFDYDCNNLIERLQWAMNNDHEARTIAQAANDAATNCLKYSDLFVYFYAVITEYAKLQAYKN